MKIKLSAAFTDGMDGSYYVVFFDSREKALKYLDRTEEQMEQGNTYDDGAIEEVEFEFEQTENGLKLINEPGFSVE